MCVDSPRFIKIFLSLIPQYQVVKFKEPYKLVSLFWNYLEFVIKFSVEVQGTTKKNSLTNSAKILDIHTRVNLIELSCIQPRSHSLFYQQVYWVGPFIGGVLAALMYNILFYVNDEECTRSYTETKKDDVEMATTS